MYSIDHGKDKHGLSLSFFALVVVLLIEALFEPISLWKTAALQNLFEDERYSTSVSGIDNLLGNLYTMDADDGDWFFGIEPCELEGNSTNQHGDELSKLLHSYISDASSLPGPTGNRLHFFFM